MNVTWRRLDRTATAKVFSRSGQARTCDTRCREAKSHDTACVNAPCLGASSLQAGPEAREKRHPAWIVGKPEVIQKRGSRKLAGLVPVSPVVGNRSGLTTSAACVIKSVDALKNHLFVGNRGILGRFQRTSAIVSKLIGSVNTRAFVVTNSRRIQSAALISILLRNAY